MANSTSARSGAKSSGANKPSFPLGLHRPVGEENPWGVLLFRDGYRKMQELSDEADQTLPCCS